MDSSFLALLSQTFQLYLEDFDVEKFILQLNEYKQMNKKQYFTLKSQIDIIYKYTKNDKILNILNKIYEWEINNKALDHYTLKKNIRAKNIGLAIIDDSGSFVMTDVFCRKILETQSPKNIFDCFSNLSYQNIKNQKIIMNDIDHQMKFTIYSSKNRKKALKKFKQLRKKQYFPIDSDFIYAKYLKTVEVEMKVLSVYLDKQLTRNLSGIQINKSFIGKQFKGAVCYFSESVLPEKFTTKQLAEDQQIATWEDKWCQKKVKIEEVKVED